MINHGELLLGVASTRINWANELFSKFLVICQSAYGPNYLLALAAGFWILQWQSHLKIKRKPINMLWIYGFWFPSGTYTNGYSACISPLCHNTIYNLIYPIRKTTSRNPSNKKKMKMKKKHRQYEKKKNAWDPALKTQIKVWTLLPHQRERTSYNFPFPRWFSNTNL